MPSESATPNREGFTSRIVYAIPWLTPFLFFPGVLSIFFLSEGKIDVWWKLVFPGLGFLLFLCAGTIGFVACLFVLFSKRKDLAKNWFQIVIYSLLGVYNLCLLPPIAFFLKDNGISVWFF